MNEQLRRLLVVLPRIVAEQGILLADLAQELQCTETQLQDDFRQLSLIGLPPFTPDDLVDIRVEQGRVYVDFDADFARPARLLASEAAALALAVRAIAPADPLLQQALVKLRRAVNPLQLPVYEAFCLNMMPAQKQEDQELRHLIENAIRLRFKVEIVYAAKSDTTPQPRIICPRMIATADSIEYLSAQRDDGQERLYRLDRILSAQKHDSEFDPLPAYDVKAALQKAVVLDKNRDLPVCLVEFDESLTAAVLARHPDAVILENKKVHVQQPYASALWVISSVLSWGGGARILSPPEIRAAFRSQVHLMRVHHEKTHSA